jgi:SH3 domain
MDSMESILSDSAVCNSNATAAAQTARSSTLQPSKSPGNIANFCKSLESNPPSQASDCFSSVTLESTTCGMKISFILGFLIVNERTTYCENNSSDTCCGSTSNSDGNFLNPARNTYVLAGIVAGSLVAIAIGFFIFQRYSKSRQRPTTAYHPERDTKTFSTFSTMKDNPSVPELSDDRGRSSLFTTIRASHLFGNGSTKDSKTGSYNLDKGDNANKVQIFEDYDAGLDDEMSCSIGDIIIVKERFDDGWATGFNITSGEEGIFPLAISESLNHLRPPSSRAGRPRSNLSARSQSLLPSAKY